MTIQTPEQVAEALYARMMGENGERTRDKWIELVAAAIAADRRALLAESEEVMEAMANAALEDDPIVFSCLTVSERRETAAAMFAALRRHHGVE